MLANEAKEIANRIAEVQSSIAQVARTAGRSPGEITLLAVSKKQSAERVQAAYDAGLRDFGENYVQGLDEHRALLPADARWHFIGHLQSKKAKRVANVHLIHSIDSSKLAMKLATAATELGYVLPCLINVNISMQESKSGVVASEAIALIAELAQHASLEVRGLMCIPSQTEEPKRAFARLRQLRDDAQKATGLPLPELSMGMSGDYKDAIAEGSTILRVGTQIFGPRNLF
ncbi:MAG: YggS family pyridoxal phosphate-dependent enzyme [Myxococcales bacterium]|nr:YggS family pyridoxal phosphate-dependent enzyme [Myxococcales bacterium]